MDLHPVHNASLKDLSLLLFSEFVLVGMAPSTGASHPLQTRWQPPGGDYWRLESSGMKGAAKWTVAVMLVSFLSRPASALVGHLVMKVRRVGT